MWKQIKFHREHEDFFHRFSTDEPATKNGGMQKVAICNWQYPACNLLHHLRNILHGLAWHCRFALIILNDQNQILLSVYQPESAENTEFASVFFQLIFVWYANCLRRLRSFHARTEFVHQCEMSFAFPPVIRQKKPFNLPLESNLC